MHRFPKDEGLQRLWTHFVMRHRTKFALCSTLLSVPTTSHLLPLSASYFWELKQSENPVTFGTTHSNLISTS